MSELSPADLKLLQTIRAFGELGGRPLLPQLGVPTRADQRLIDGGFVELRGDRLHVTHAGMKLLLTLETSVPGGAP